MLNKQILRLTASESYTIFSGSAMMSEFQSFIDKNEYENAIIIVDGNVLQLQKTFVESLRQCFGNAEILQITPGEKSKDFKTYKKIVDFCLKQNVSRNTPIVAIGGGVVGDLAGFAAATILRGVPLIHVSTTLLAMVDSSIGGKTGINHKAGKNLVGSFYQPAAVFSDLLILETLPEQEFLCGFGEILKYGAISDSIILEVLKGRNFSELRTNVTQLESIVQRCIKIKGDIVTRDTRESGERAYLNFGHTFAHSIEKCLGYGTISHGQAVYIGMVAAVFLSHKNGSQLNENLLLEHAAQMKLSADFFTIDSEDLIKGMQQDKKKKQGSLRFVLLQQYGRPYLKTIEDLSEVKEAWETTKEKLKEILE